MTGPATVTSIDATIERDPFIDFVRAFSLLVVVAWHWVFTIVIWEDDGPHATNPIGFTSGLFLATWLLQVMPLFFFVGGHAHQAAWAKAEARGTRIWHYVLRRARQLAVPALALLAVWIGIGIAVTVRFDVEWMGRAVKLVVSPLWFMAVYLLLVLLFPLADRLHERFDALVVVWAAGAAVLVDVLRFRHGEEWVGWFNMVLVWGLCHQLGFFYDRLVALGRRAAWMFTWSGLFALGALTWSGLYPGSMVGVPGERFSNMAPPTIGIVALVMLQAGVALLVRPWVLDRLETRGRWARVNEVVNRFSMPLFLFHSTGMAVSRAIAHYVFEADAPRQPDAGWWLRRPLAFIGPLVFTLPVIFLFGRKYVKGARRSRAS